MNRVQDIKLVFFSDDNTNYLTEFINKQSSNVSSNVRDILFKTQNVVFNDFIESISKDLDINNVDIEDILISLNKILIQRVLNLGSTPPDKLFENKYSQTGLSRPYDETRVPIPVSTPVPTPVPVPVIVTPKKICHEKNIQTQQQRLYHIISSNLDFKEGIYSLDSVDINQKGKMRIFNNLYNISDNNNKLEINKTKIYINSGNYNLISLLQSIEESLNKKLKLQFKVTYDTFKNRITIKNDIGNADPHSSNFNLNFNDIDGNLKWILGFTNNNYINNNSYTTELDPQLNYYNTIYIKIENNDFYTVLNYPTPFTYTKKINFDTFSRFNWVTLDLDICIQKKICISFYTFFKNKFEIIKSPILWEFN
jgi:hypothetical protein